jgi:thiol-disulfide isomerase/thioredoxin
VILLTITPRATALTLLVAASVPAIPVQAQAPAPAARPSAAPNLAPGDVVTPFDAVGMDGVSRRVDFPKGQETVLLFFLSSCPVCHKMLPIWTEYYQRRPKSLSVVGVMLDAPPPGFFETLPIGFPVLRSPGSELNRAYKISHVPMTIRIGPGGKVEEVGEGVLDPIKLGQIFRP